MGPSNIFIWYRWRSGIGRNTIPLFQRNRGSGLIGLMAPQNMHLMILIQVSWPPGVINMHFQYSQGFTVFGNWKHGHNNVSLSVLMTVRIEVLNTNGVGLSLSLLTLLAYFPEN